jgi:hypothetical protein
MSDRGNEGAGVYRASGIKSATRKNRRTKANIEEIKKAFLEILEADHPQTVRQVFYQVVSRGLVDKTEAEYDGTVSRLLGDMPRTRSCRGSGSLTILDGGARRPALAD